MAERCQGWWPLSPEDEVGYGVVFDGGQPDQVQLLGEGVELLCVTHLSSWAVDSRNEEQGLGPSCLHEIGEIVCGVIDQFERKGQGAQATALEKIGDSDICRVLDRHDVPGLGYRTESEIKGVLGTVGDMDLLGLRGQA